MTDGSDDLHLTLAGYGRLPRPAQQKLAELLRAHGNEIVLGASRLEERWRTDEDDEPQITARDVADAAIMVFRVPASKRSSKDKTLESVSYIAAFIGGIFGNNIATPVGAVGFAVCAGVGITAYSLRSS